jgi:hypothetical protein
VNSGINSINITSFAVSGNNLFAGASPTTTPYTLGGIYRSQDNGDSWTAVNTGLTSWIITSFAVIGNSIFTATTEAGVFLTMNNGDSWGTVNTGLTETNITVLGVYNGYLFAGTYAGNIWRRPLSEMVGVRYAFKAEKRQRVVDLRLDCNNNLRYTLAEGASVSVKVFDMRGRLVYSLTPRRQPTGSYSTPLAGRLSRGSYVIDFSVGNAKVRRTVTVM